MSSEVFTAPWLELIRLSPVNLLVNLLFSEFIISEFIIYY